MKRYLSLLLTLAAAASILAGCAGGPLALFQPSSTPTATSTPVPTATPMPTAVPPTVTPSPTPIPPPAVISAENAGQLTFQRIYGIGPLVRLKISPDGNSILLAYATRLQLIQLTGLSEIWQIDPGLVVKDATFSQDGKQVIVQSIGGSVKIWDAATASLMAEPIKQPVGVTQLALSPGGNWAAYTDYTGVTRIMYAASGEFKATNNGQSYPAGITGLLLSPDETTLAIAGLDSVPRNQMHQWKVTDNKFKNIMLDLPVEMTNWKYSADGKLLFGIDAASLTAEPSTKLMVWNTVTGMVQKSFPRVDLIADYLPSPDAKTILISTGDGLLKLIDAASGADLGSFARHESDIVGMAFTPDSKAVVTASQDGKIIVWDTFSQKSLQEMQGTPVTPSVTPAFASNTDLALILTPDRRYLGLLNTLTWETESKLGDGSLRFSTLALSSSASYAAALDENNHVHVWDMSNGKEILISNIITRSPITKLKFSPNEKYITSLSEGQVLTWDLASGEQMKDLPGVNDFAYSPDNTFIAAGGDDYNLYLTDLQTGIMKSDIPAEEVNALAFSPDGSLIAVGARRVQPQKASQLNFIFEYDLVNNKRGPLQFPEIPGQVNALAFHLTKEILASSDMQGNITLWNLRDGAVLMQFNEIAAAPATLQFSQDGALLFVGGGDGTISVIATSDISARQ